MQGLINFVGKKMPDLQLGHCISLKSNNLFTEQLSLDIYNNIKKPKGYTLSPSLLSHPTLVTDRGWHLNDLRNWNYMKAKYNIG